MCKPYLPIANGKNSKDFLSGFMEIYHFNTEGRNKFSGFLLVVVKVKDWGQWSVDFTMLLLWLSNKFKSLSWILVTELFVMGFYLYV